MFLGTENTVVRNLVARDRLIQEKSMNLNENKQIPRQVCSLHVYLRIYRLYIKGYFNDCDRESWLVMRRNAACCYN